MAEGTGTAASGMVLMALGAWLILQTIVGGLPDRILSLRAGTGTKKNTGNPVFPTEPPVLATPAGPGRVSGTPTPVPGRSGPTVPPPPSGQIPSTPPSHSG